MEYSRRDALMKAYSGGHKSFGVDMEGAVAAFARFMECLGFDPAESEHLYDTPGRVTEMYNQLLGGGDPFSLTTFPNPDYDTEKGSPEPELIIVRDIPFTSFCAHHFLPFTGVAHIGYVPGKNIVGLSKLARIVNKVAAAPQVQEAITVEVADWLQEALEPKGVGVIIRARHSCMEIRGPKAVGAETVTRAFRGVLSDRDDQSRIEMSRLAE